MGAMHEQVLPQLHGRLHDTRQELERMRALAIELAEALEDEVDARHGTTRLGLTPTERSRNTGRALHQARQEGLL